MSNFIETLSDDEIDEVIEYARLNGMRLPRTNSAIKFGYVMMRSPHGMAHTTFVKDKNDLDDLRVRMCPNGCCLTMVAVPDRVALLAQVIEVVMGPEKVEQLFNSRGATFRDVIFTMD